MTPNQRKALIEAEATFRRYGDIHAAKPDPVKAAANYELADRMAAALAEVVEPVAIRGNFDGFGYDYVDNGHGSNWLDRHPDWERLYTE